MIEQAELQWMKSKRTLNLGQGDLKLRLILDYGADEAHEMLDAFATGQLEHLAGALAWPGVGTRWRMYLRFAKKLDGAANFTCEQAFDLFAQRLERVVTHRALTLTDAQLGSIQADDAIFPKGRLIAEQAAVDAVVEERGVAAVCVARLFISVQSRLIGPIDPSVSLHDEWQTAVTIAGGYTDKPGCHLFVFVLNVPVVESCGWTMQDVTDRAPALMPSNVPVDRERLGGRPTSAGSS